MTDQVDQLAELLVELNRMTGGQPAQRLDAFRGIIDTITGYPNPAFMYAGLNRFERQAAVELQQRCRNRLFVLSHAAGPSDKIVTPADPAGTILNHARPQGSA